MTYLKKEHFENIAPEGADIIRLSAKAVEYNTDKEKGIIYVNTIVFKKDKESLDIELNSDGRRTNTTKKRMNYGLDGYASVCQKNFERFVEIDEMGLEKETIPYEDNMQL